MNKELFARNLRIHAQLYELLKEFSRAGIEVILLKGIALIELFPDYMHEREMEDMDLLIKPSKIKKVREIIKALGYKKAPLDPDAYYREGTLAAIDITDALWYLSTEENADLWKHSLKIPVQSAVSDVFYLNPVDFYIHVQAHARIHHAKNDEKWQKDLAILKEKFKDNLTDTGLDIWIQKYGLSKALSVSVTDIPRIGHISRFAFLPLKKKMIYLFKAIFPSNDFLLNRYDLKNVFEITLYRFSRPFLLFLETFKLSLSFISKSEKKNA
ncbi:MAG: hypothetical protein A2252_10780 [Elusimicrobia bacterium RIFOXYA2_FULL_39_19]|nr:MAG: hypothetical protein A2252_10780 [Elusimicrobia bacterium RIFOXYA2_FULL_39_19]